MRRALITALILAPFFQVRAFAAELPFQPGETITFAIKKFGIKVGDASLVFKGPARMEGRDVLLVVFSSTAMNFMDKEGIYFDPQTFLPVVVTRDLNIWGKKEQIIERYDARAGKVVITKKAGGRVTESVIEKKYALDNVYCFIYRYRKEGVFKVGDKVRMRLPTADVSFQIVRKDTIQAGGKRRDAFYMQSDSGEYRVWFDAAPRNIPLRIDGAVGLGSAVLIMTEYKP